MIDHTARESVNNRAASFAERAVIFENFLDSVRDADGIVYADVHARELRPFRSEDLDAKGFDVWVVWAHDFAGCLNYEDSLMATGRYINGKVLRHLATGGDDRALADAEHGVRAILAISKAGRDIEPGYLPKPYGGLRNASACMHASSDQYEQSLLALWSFRRACPRSELVPEIESAIVSWADYFLRHDFAYRFNEFAWVALDPTDMGDGVEVSVGRHGLGLCLPLFLMSYEITGHMKYDDALRNRLVPCLRRWLAHPTGPGSGFSGHSNSANLLALGLYYCITQGVAVEEAKAGLEICWNCAEQRLSRYDGLEYEYAHAGASDDHPLEPHHLDAPLPADGWKFALWVSNVKTAGSVITAHTGALCQRVDARAERAATIQRIMNEFVEPQSFLRWIDNNGGQIPPEHAWHALLLPSVFPAAWLQAYHLMQMPTEMDGW
jgi:hypothetical protein